VLSEIFAPGSDPAERSVTTTHYGEGTHATDDGGEDEEDFSDVEDRLKGLGYME
jgi:hypothetical protein